MKIQQGIVMQIEAAGYRVTGYRDAIGDGQDGSLFVTAEHCGTGERQSVCVNTRGSAGEVEACRQLAAKLGIRLDDGQ